MLHYGEVRLSGIMHMEAYLLDGVGDVRASERRVLEGLSDAPELSWISKRRPRSGRDVGMRVNGRRGWLAVHHANTLKGVESELALSEEVSISLTLYREPQKIVKRVEVLHGKFPLEGIYGVL
jgi:hypothetical protein